jgi:hypothetical protein
LTFPRARFGCCESVLLDFIIRPPKSFSASRSSSDCRCYIDFEKGSSNYFCQVTFSLLCSIFDNSCSGAPHPRVSPFTAPFSGNNSGSVPSRRRFSSVGSLDTYQLLPLHVRLPFCPLPPTHWLPPNQPSQYILIPDQAPPIII